MSSDNTVHQLKLGVHFGVWVECRDRDETREQPEQGQGKYYSTLLLSWHGTWTEHYIAEGTPDESGKGIFKGIAFPVVALKCPSDDGLDIGVDNQFFQVLAVFRDRNEAPHGVIGRAGAWDLS